MSTVPNIVDWPEWRRQADKLQAVLNEMAADGYTVTSLIFGRYNRDSDGWTIGMNDVGSFLARTLMDRSP